MNKNIINNLIAGIGCFVILLIGGFTFNQMYTNHQENQLIIQKCFEAFDQSEQLTLKKDGFWSPVVCEKE